MTRESNPATMLGACLAVLLILPFQAWLLMLVLGAVHSVAAVVPAVGFGTAVLFVIGLNMLTGYARRILGRK
ncbi:MULTISPECIES: hypothetical protein [unclassified Streptomyces]|uniref:hypothetical protein n=1 Tax=unclassified Streptomyces TaxID=2593676 RepID=UPI003D758556